MTQRHSLAVALLLVAVAVAATSAALAEPALVKPQLRVSSTLDRTRVLPLRSRWIAFPKVSAARVADVDFLIDGKLRWVEHEAPYNYASDDLRGHLGFLITTWLAPGMHRFTARVETTTGQRGQNTVVARVLPAPKPPAELAGAWKRIVPHAGDGPPTGEWKLVFDNIGAWHLDPLGSGVVNQYDVDGDVIHAYAPIQMAPFSSGHGGVDRYGAREIGGTDCREDGPFGSYHWAVVENTLTLTAIEEGCPGRRTIWEGIWTRVG